MTKYEMRNSQSKSKMMMNMMAAMGCRKQRVTAPMMVTEYSFGATDRGMWYAGVGTPAQSQSDRVARYRRFIDSVVANPGFVGAHWFQYTDQPASGRTLEGENGQYGFVDIADNPYPEMVEASRDVATSIYARLAKAGRD